MSKSKNDSTRCQRTTALDTIHIRYCYFLIFNTAKHLATLVTCSGRFIFFSGKKLDYKSRPYFLFPVGKNPRIRVAPSDRGFAALALSVDFQGLKVLQKAGNGKLRITMGGSGGGGDSHRVHLRNALRKLPPGEQDEDQDEIAELAEKIK